MRPDELPEARPSAVILEAFLHTSQLLWCSGNYLSRLLEYEGGHWQGDFRLMSLRRARLHLAVHRGSQHPSDDAHVNVVPSYPGQVPVYIIVNPSDERLDTTDYRKMEPSSCGSRSCSTVCPTTQNFLE